MERKEFEEHLKKVIIPFWKKLHDDEFGGFYGYMNQELRIDKKAVKGCILNSRITWFFSRAYLELNDEKLLKEAEHGYKFLKEKCVDKEYGGVYWSVNYDGTPFDTTKHTYNQAFAIYALSEFYKATKKEEAYELAKSLFKLIETRCTDEFGYLEAFKRDFLPESNEKLSENGVMAQKTMNTLLHVMEAYTSLYELKHDKVVEYALKRILGILETKIYNPILKRQEVFFDEEYNSILDLHSFGHDIETSWLLEHTLDVLKEKTLKNHLLSIVRELAEETYEDAYNGESFANECDRGVMNEHRVWWVQAEAVTGFYNAYQNTKNIKYKDAAENIWQFILKYVYDNRKGSEWYWEVDPGGKPYPDRPIVEEWKCPYHNGRMCFEMMNRLRK